MTILEMAAELESEAKRIRDLDKHRRLPVQDIDLNAAITRMKAALEDGQEFSIGMELSESPTYRGKEMKTTVKWSVSHSYTSYRGDTLAEALNAALASLGPEKEGEPAKEIAALEAAFAEPLPL